MDAIREDVRANWAAAADPAELFIILWHLAAPWTPADRAILPRPTLAKRHQLRAGLGQDTGAAAVADLLACANRDWAEGETQLDRRMGAGFVLEVMRAIEESFATIHPRTRNCAPTLSPSIDLPEWLDAAERRRLRYGSFAETHGGRLIPSGPFSRHARGRVASGANNLQDEFPYLTVAPVQAHEADRPIDIHMKVIGTDVMRGVPGADTIGRERIRFIPVAEAREDLEFTTRTLGDQPMVDVRPTIDSAARLLQALYGGPEVDLAFSPELTIPGESERTIGEGIAALARLAPRIILAGTGLTEETGECGRSWNEARVFGRGGHLLWRQRKIWPYGMSRENAIRFGLPDPGVDVSLMEDIAGNSILTIVDMDGFGRCLVLICQDLQGRPFVEDIVTRYQPDWILTPVLDSGVNVPGWAHTRAVALSAAAQSRILVGSSLTMSLLGDGGHEPPIGLAVGPANGTKELDGTVGRARAVALVQAAAGPTPRSGFLVWDYSESAWTQSSVSAVTPT